MVKPLTSFYLVPLQTCEATPLLLRLHDTMFNDEQRHYLYGEEVADTVTVIQGVQLKSGPYFNMCNLFTKIYMLYYTTNLYIQ